MTEQPRRYENYPPTAEAGDPPAVPEGGATPSGWMAPTPAPTPPPTSFPNRRQLLGGLIGVGLLAAVPIIAAATGSGDPSDVPEEDTDPGDPVDESDTEDYDLAGLEIDVPTGWTEMSSNEHRLVIGKAGSTVTFLHYAAGQDATAADEAQQQLRRYAADVRKAGEVSTTSKADDQFEKAEAVLSGEVDGAPVTVSSQVVIDTEDDNYDAAAVVSVIKTTAAEDLRAEIERMRRDFFDQLG